MAQAFPTSRIQFLAPARRPVRPNRCTGRGASRHAYISAEDSVTLAWPGPDGPFSGPSDIMAVLPARLEIVPIGPPI
jgi:hypothetical protein